MTPKRAPKQVHAASTPRRYRLHVIELGKDPEWVYVGETALAPRDRLRQHREGYQGSRVVRRLGGPAAARPVPGLGAMRDARRGARRRAGARRSAAVPRVPRRGRSLTTQRPPAA